MVALLAGVFLLYRQSSESLIELWNDTGRITYTHGFAVVALAAWLIVRRRRQLAEQPRSASLVGAALTVLAGGLWFLAVRAGIEIVHQLLLVPLMLLTLWALFGLRTSRALWLPVAFLFFAMPVWDVVNPLLQSATVHAVHVLLEITGIPAYVDGNFVHVAAGVFEVAGGCSGIHFFIVSLALGTLYGELGRDTWKVRGLLLALAAGFALFANWVRVFIIVVAGHLTNMQHYLIRKEHYNFGWAVFAAMMLVYLLIARRIAPPERDELAAPESESIPVTETRAAVMLMALACVVAMPVWEIANPVQAAPMPAAGESLPHAPSGWVRVSSGTPTWNPVFAGADREERAEYADVQGGRLEVFVATYAMQRQKKELIAYGNSLIGANEGAVVSSASAHTDAPAHEIVVENVDQRALIRYYYLVGNRRTERGIVAQLWYGWSALSGASNSSVVAMRTPCVPDCDSARARLNDFSRQ
jgi:exosortase A